MLTRISVGLPLPTYTQKTKLLFLLAQNSYFKCLFNYSLRLLALLPATHQLHSIIGFAGSFVRTNVGQSRYPQLHIHCQGSFKRGKQSTIAFDSHVILISNCSPYNVIADEN